MAALRAAGVAGGQLQKAIMVMMAVVMISNMNWGAEAATADCTTLLGSLAPCVPFVSNAEDAPSAACCSGLASVVQANASCLCLVLNSPSVPNITRAEELPSLCNVSIPDPTSLCPALPPTSGSPTPSASPPDATPTWSASPPKANEDVNAMPPGMYMGPIPGGNGETNFACHLDPSSFFNTIKSVSGTVMFIFLMQAFLHY